MFGYLTGRFSSVRESRETDQLAKSTKFVAKPGAIKSVAYDFNKDGHTRPPRSVRPGHRWHDSVYERRQRQLYPEDRISKTSPSGATPVLKWPISITMANPISSLQMEITAITNLHPSPITASASILPKRANTRRPGFIPCTAHTKLWPAILMAMATSILLLFHFFRITKNPPAKVLSISKTRVI